MTVIEIFEAINGFYELESERNERILESARIISFYAVTPYLDKSSSIKKPADLFELTSDKKRKKKKRTDLTPVVIEIIHHAK